MQPVTLQTATGVDLSAGEQNAIVEGLQRGLPHLRIRRYFAIHPGYWAACEAVCVARDGDAVVAALASSTRRLPGGEEFLHIRLNLLAERHQRTGLLRQMWGVHLAHLWQTGRFRRTMVLKTFNPLAYRALEAMARVPEVALFPRIGAASSARLAALAGEVAGCIAPGLLYERDTGVVRGAGVPPDFYPALPEGAPPRVTDYFRRHVGAGDRLLCLLDIGSAAAERRILRALGAQVSGSPAGPGENSHEDRSEH